MLSISKHWSWACFFCHFRKTCTIQSFPIKKFERRDNSKLHLYIDFCWPLTTTKIINQKYLNHRFFCHLIGFCYVWKTFLPLFFLGKSKFLQVLDSVLRLEKVFRGSSSNRYIQRMNLTNSPGNHTQIYIFKTKNKTPTPEVPKLRIVLTSCPLLFTYWLGYAQ